VPTALARVDDGSTYPSFSDARRVGHVEDLQCRRTRYRVDPDPVRTSELDKYDDLQLMVGSRGGCAHGATTDMLPQRVWRLRKGEHEATVRAVPGIGPRSC
jgi:hypothetical protein